MADALAAIKAVVFDQHVPVGHRDDQTPRWPSWFMLRELERYGRTGR